VSLAVAKACQDKSLDEQARLDMTFDIEMEDGGVVTRMMSEINAEMAQVAAAGRAARGKTKKKVEPFNILKTNRFLQPGRREDQSESDDDSIDDDDDDDEAEHNDSSFGTGLSKRIQKLTPNLQKVKKEEEDE